MSAMLIEATHSASQVGTLAPWLQLGTLVLTLFLVGTAYLGARETRKSATGQLLNQLSERFWSKEFHRASRRLGSWEQRDDFVESFDGLLDSDEPLREEGEARISDRVRWARRADEARRFVKGYYHTVWRHRKAGTIDDDDVKNLLTSERGTELLLKIVEPLEQAVTPDYDPSQTNLYGYFDRLYDEKLKRPLRP